MTYDEGLAQRIRELLAEQPGLSEKKMFGGIGFLFYGNMACGVIKNDLIVRVGPENYENALTLPHTRKFDFTGRPMKGWLVVANEGLEEDDNLSEWVQRGVRFSLTLPPKL